MIDGDSLIHGSYGYAGFLYYIHEDMNNILYAIPYSGQHKNASKQKHRLAAVESFEEEYQWSKRLKR